MAVQIVTVLADILGRSVVYESSGRDISFLGVLPANQ